MLSISAQCTSVTDRIYFIFLFFLFIGLKHKNHANKHNMPRSMNRTLTDVSKITFDSYAN